MAQRGTKPKPAHLRLIDGTHRTTRHGAADASRKGVETAVKAFGTLTRPASLKGEARKAWDKYIAPAAWLDASREPAAIAFCELWSQFVESPAHFVAAKHGQLRAYMAELGLTDERNRAPVENAEEDEFFGKN